MVTCYPIPGATGRRRRKNGLHFFALSFFVLFSAFFSSIQFIGPDLSPPTPQPTPTAPAVPGPVPEPAPAAIIPPPPRDPSVPPAPPGAPAASLSCGPPPVTRVTRVCILRFSRLFGFTSGFHFRFFTSGLYAYLRFSLEAQLQVCIPSAFLQIRHWRREPKKKSAVTAYARCERLRVRVGRRGKRREKGEGRQNRDGGGVEKVEQSRGG